MEQVLTTGQVYSFVKEAPHWRTHDLEGRTMPWWTRPSLEWLASLPLKELTIFEYGCGISSMWFIHNVFASFGVDHNVDWLPDEDGYWYTTSKKEYINSPGHIDAALRKYDLIIIDGIHRDECTEYALQWLKPGAYLICDNFEQASADLAHWPKTRELTKNMPFTLYKEPSHYDWVTAVFHNI